MGYGIVIATGKQALTFLFGFAWLGIFVLVFLDDCMNDARRVSFNMMCAHKHFSIIRLRHSHHLT